jgi:hypothetical protein
MLVQTQQKIVTQTDIAIQNPSNQTISLPASSGITIGVNEINIGILLI